MFATSVAFRALLSLDIASASSGPSVRAIDPVAQTRATAPAIRFKYRLVTFIRHLPQGIPESTSLARYWSLPVTTNKQILFHNQERQINHMITMAEYEFLIGCVKFCDR